jgi:hypothetical protein
MDRKTVCVNERNQAEANSVFTLMISEISVQKVKISSTSKTCDMSVLIRDEGRILKILQRLHAAADRGYSGSLQTGGYPPFV